jgi:hypothetical protein
MAKRPAIVSEDDVRTKIVAPWLRDHGFSMDNISIEFSFSIRLGKSISIIENGTVRRNSSADRTGSSNSTFSPRADVLVRDGEGRNLFVVEVKGPDEPLDEDARDQGISYARLLLNGNIAPFVLLTNGVDSQVFDSITKQRVDGQELKVRAYTFVVGADDLALKAEALESLISLSSANMLAFCDAQTSHRMRPLMGSEIDSDKKYIPSLFIEREYAKAEFLQLLDEQHRRVVLLIGPPQVGKTNFVCQMVRDRLSAGFPTLFFPAIGLRKSLLNEISEDFEWTFGSAEASNTLLIRKIGRVLRRLGKTLTIFIDGWNEANVQLARTIDNECSRLSCDYIQIVVSLTSTAATRLLTGSAGNPAFLADEAKLPGAAAQLIELSPGAITRSDEWSLVNLTTYSMAERDLAYKIYAAAYGVSVPDTHKKVYEPYILGAAMKQFQNSTLPDTLDEPGLLKYVLEKKAIRAVGLDHYDVRVCLREVAREMFHNGAPVSIEAVARIWSIPLSEKIPAGFFEAALLSKEIDEFGIPSVDFYYGRERDFSIAYIAQNWVGKLAAGEDITREFEHAITSQAGTDALRWFLKQPSHIDLISQPDGTLLNFDDVLLKRALFASLCELANVNHDYNDELLRYATLHAIHDSDNLVKIGATRLVALVTEDVDELTEILVAAKLKIHNFVEAILGVGEEFPLQTASVGQVVMDALRSLHWDSSDPDEGTSEITDILSVLSGHSSDVIRKEALTCFGYVAPHAFLQYVSGQIYAGWLSDNAKKMSEFETGIEEASKELLECYYGGMWGCPGALESICEEPEYQEQEYEKMRVILSPIIFTFGYLSSCQSFLDILNDLSRGLESKENGETANSPLTFPDLFTLPLQFNDDAE